MDYPDWLIKLGFRVSRGADGRALLYERIAEQVSYGTPILDAVQRLSARAFRRGGQSDPEGLILSRAAGTMRAAGTSFASAMRWWIPAEEYALLDASEESGRIADALRMAVKLDRMRRAMMREVLAGLLNPLILFGVLYAILWFLGSSALAPVIKIAKHVQLSGLGGAVVAMGKITREWWFIASPLIFVIFGAIAIWSLPRWTGRVRKFFDHLPPWSIYRYMQGAIWLSSFAALVGTGMAERDALARMIRSGVPWLVERLQKMRKNMLAGMSSGQALDEAGDQFPDPDTIDDMSVYAEYPDFADKLAMLADRAVVQSQAKIRKTTGLVVALANIAINIVIILTVLGIANLMSAMGSHYGM